MCRAAQGARALDPWAIHAEVRPLYSWTRSARGVARVYEDLARGGKSAAALDVVDRAARHRLAGPLLGLISFAVLTVVHCVLWLCSVVRPAHAVETAPDWSEACRRQQR